MRYALVYGGSVINVILWDGVAPYNLRSGETLIRSDTLQIGDTYNA